MRWIALVGLVGMLSGCGPETAEEQAPAEKTQQATESWCRSYTTQQYCPKYYCSWYSSPAPGYCGLPATSVQGAEQQ